MATSSTRTIRRQQRISSTNLVNDQGTTVLWNLFTSRPKPSVVTPEMAFYCFDILLSKLKDTSHTVSVDLSSFSQIKCPVFVSWSRKKRNAELRGSIGTFESIPVVTALRDFAVASALKDDRFKPITSDELPDLQVTVVVLWNFEEGKHFLDWTVGLHGIQVILNERKRESDKRMASILPEHALKTGWTKVETIDALMREAGFIGKITGEDRQILKITRFQTQKITETYDDFNQFRNWKSRNPSPAIVPEKKLASVPLGLKSTRF